MSTYNVNRPKPGETLEDLIELEKDFLEAQKVRRDVKPAATAVRVDPHLILAANSPLGDGKHEAPKENCFTGFIIEKESQTQSPIEIPSSRKVERSSKFKLERLNRDAPEMGSGNQSTLDVMQKIRKNYDLFDPLKSNTLPGSQNVTNSPESGSRLADDNSIGEKIHPLLAGYTESDILQARESLLRSMKPETREILAKRRTATAEGSKVSPGKEKGIAGIDERITSENFANMPHMDKLEEEKLEWTKPVTDPLTTEDPSSVIKAEDSNLGRAARFALDGKLITKELEKDSDSWNKGLHHHGEEMDRPGYTIEELFTLSRSILPHQRTLGFNVLSEIFHRAHAGEFDFALDPSIFQACNELDFVHVLRTGADFRDSLSMNASINCMAALLCPEQEELCLDIAFNWPNAEPFPWLIVTPKASSAAVPVDSGEEITDSDLKDFQHVKNDLLEFLIIRTNVIVRFNYILNTKIELLNESGVQGILKLLIRIARHSPNALMDSRELLEGIQKHFMSPNWSHTGDRPGNMSGVPLSLAVKLFRILASSNAENATKLYNEFDLFPAIMSYLAFSDWRSQNLVMNVEFLILESSNLWEMFLNHGLGIREYMSFFPVMMSFFQAFYNRSTLGSFDLTHLARLTSLLGKALTVLNSFETPHTQYRAFKESVDFISSIIVKLFAMLGRHDTAKLLDQDLCSLAILKGLECLNLARKYERFPKVDAALLKFVDSFAYRELTKNLMIHSLLLFHRREPLSDPTKEKSKYPTNIISCGAILFGGFQTPILDKGSPFAFLTSLLRYTTNMYESNENLKEVLLDDNCKEYLRELGSKNHVSRVNYFLRFELYCVRELLNLLPLAGQLPPISKILYHVEAGDESLARELLEILIKSTGVPEPQEFTNFYTRFLFVQTLTENPYNFKQLSSKVIPQHWILEPLNILHQSKTSESQLKPQLKEALKEIVKNGVETTLGFVIFCLKNCDWILISSVMDIPAFYTRIVLIFMLGNQLFLEPTIRSQLKEVLELLLSKKIWSKAKNKPIFSKLNKVGFTTFSSFYSELLQEFGANSFGDEVFGAYLMLPLSTPEDIRIKSLFWKDQAARFLRTRVETSVVPLEYFTSVQETMDEMLQIYRSAVHTHSITAERNQLLHAIINFHLTGIERKE